MIRFENVTKQFDDGTTAVKSLNLTVHEGEFFVLIGPSGSGKTTTLKMINRLINRSDGAIFINGKEISEYEIHELRWNIGYVLQQIALFPHMTVEENIAVVPEMKKWKREKIVRKVDELLEMVGLDPNTYKHRKPSELSGGQQQRIGVVRALAADPEILLMDEPFSALDPISRVKLQDDIVKLHKTIKKTIVFVTHDIQEALKLGDRICMMNDGEIVQVGTPTELIHHPANDFVKDFIGNGKHDKEEFSMEYLISRTIHESDVEGLPIIPFSASLEQALEALFEQDEVAVENGGKIIGLLSRKAMIQHVLHNVKEGGKQHE